MSPLQFRGKRILLALIAVIIVCQFWNIGLITMQAEWDSRSLRSITKSVAVVGAALMLLRGEVWLVRHMIAYFLLMGLADLVIAGKIMTAVLAETPPGAGGAVLDIFLRVCGVLAAFGLFHIIVGLLLWWLPSIRAYFAYQRGSGSRVIVQEV